MCVFFRHQSTSIKYENHVRTFQKLRNKKMPPSPNSIAEILAAYQNVDVMNLYGMTKHDEQRVFFKHAQQTESINETTQEKETHSFCLFASQSIADLIQENIDVNRRRYLMDATFKCVPYTKSAFKQLLIIHVEYLGKVCVSIVYFVVLCLFCCSLF